MDCKSVTPKAAHFAVPDRSMQAKKAQGGQTGSGASASSKSPQYSTTANPKNHVNIDLHRQRYRDSKSAGSTGVAAERERFRTLYNRTDWESTHMHYTEMPFSKFFMDFAVQRALYKMQVRLVDEQYERFGKTDGSWKRYTLMFRNGWSPGDKRKPVTEAFHRYCEEVYCPIMFAALFGRDGWERHVKQHWSTFKSCTIKVCEGGTSFYGKNIFHMHIDGKIGLLQKKNHSQRRMNRLLFSIVTDALKDESNASSRKYGCTDYPVWQPRKGFKSNHDFHKYMQTWYRECGLDNSGLPRPHYEIPEDLIYRARSGEVLLHFTHTEARPGQRGPQAIHSEPNPCPDRHLFVFDFVNLVRKDPSGKGYLPSVDVPEDKIIELMRPLETSTSLAFRRRMADVSATAKALLTKAAKYPGGRAAVEGVLRDIDAMLTGARQAAEKQCHECKHAVADHVATEQGGKPCRPAT